MRVHVCLLIVLSLALSAQGISFARKVRKMFADNSVCILDAKKDFARADSPVLLHSDSNEPYLPERGGRTKSVYTLKKDEVIKMTCPGDGNVLNGVGEQTAEFKCRGGTDLSSEKGGTMDSKEISCFQPVEYKTKPNAGDCAEGEGVLTEVGFEVDGDLKTMYSACYIEKTKATYYTTHIIMGSIIGGKANHIRFGYRDFSLGEIKIPTDEVSKMFDAYDEDETFGSVAQRGGGHRLANKLYLEKSWHLVPMQMVPLTDFVMAFEQRSTYFFVNTAPVWSSVRDGNLLKVEQKLRSIARERRIDLRVITAVSGKTTLDQEKNKRRKKPFYLEIIEEEEPKKSTQIPVPKHIFKIAEAANKQCMMLVIRDEPYLDKKHKFICDNECDIYHWKFNSIFRSMGYVSCCAPHNFYRVKELSKFPELNCDQALDGKLVKRRS